MRWLLPVILLGIIFASLWSRHKGRDNYIFISLFLLSLILAIYLSTLSHNLWMLFLLMIPAEVLLFFCFRLYFDKPTRRSSDLQESPFFYPEESRFYGPGVGNGPRALLQ